MIKKERESFVFLHSFMVASDLVLLLVMVFSRVVPVVFFSVVPLIAVMLLHLRGSFVLEQARQDGVGA